MDSLDDSNDSFDSTEKDLEDDGDEKLTQINDSIGNQKILDYEEVEPDKTSSVFEIDKVGEVEEEDEIEKLLRPKLAKPKTVDREQLELKAPEPSPSSKPFDEEELIQMPEEGSGDGGDFLAYESGKLEFVINSSE